MSKDIKSIGGGVANAIDLSSISERSAGSNPAQCIMSLDISILL